MATQNLCFWKTNSPLGLYHPGLSSGLFSKSKDFFARGYLHKSAVECTIIRKLHSYLETLIYKKTCMRLKRKDVICEATKNENCHQQHRLPAGVFSSSLTSSRPNGRGFVNILKKSASAQLRKRKRFLKKNIEDEKKTYFWVAL